MEGTVLLNIVQTSGICVCIRKSFTWSLAIADIQGFGGWVDHTLPSSQTTQHCLAECFVTKGDSDAVNTSLWAIQ